MTHSRDIDALNDVTKTLIDSYKGYETVGKLADDNHALQSEFERRAADRRALVGEFRNKVTALGGDPVDDGGAMGAIHRGFTKFASVFRDDEKAALSAVDDGEGYLAEEIEEQLKNSEISADVRSLLQKALQSAKSGERFADRLEEHI